MNRAYLCGGQAYAKNFSLHERQWDQTTNVPGSLVPTDPQEHRFLHLGYTATDAKRLNDSQLWPDYRRRDHSKSVHGKAKDFTLQYSKFLFI